MSGTRIGGLKAAKTNKRRYGEDTYSVRGTAGGNKTAHKLKEKRNEASGRDSQASKTNTGGSNDH